MTGRAHVPGDKSISHRALLLGGLAEGTSRVSGLGEGTDILATRAALAMMGVDFEGDLIHGGRSRLKEPERPLDMGNSGTGMRLLAGVLSSLPFLSVLIGDESIHRRPMDRVAVPLREMGALIDGREHGRFAPLAVRGGRLHGIDYTPPVASAQVKSAVLLAGLAASGETVVHEPVATRRHTEEMMRLAGANISCSSDDSDYSVELRSSTLAPFDLEIPCDPSQAAFFIIGASIVPGSDLTVENVYVGPGRAGFLDVLVRMGADISITERNTNVADIHVRYARLVGTEIGGKEIPGLIDEIPILCVAASCASGRTIIRDAGELRVKESDRIATITSEMRAIGANVEPTEDGLVVTGSGLRPRGTVRSHGDHRIAMSLAIAAMCGTEPLVISGFESVATSWPTFVVDLEAIQCN
ncbi:MAG TPA: 3-phosphoshikimate 1-carboxyvinyltransferase [Acidimicrobiales bacterium]|nr:3-phosphoshikimate 1-carboxyvinyltransferase [Acidimicrobiales bacterium]